MIGNAFCALFGWSGNKRDWRNTNHCYKCKNTNLRVMCDKEDRVIVCPCCGEIVSRFRIGGDE